MIPRHGKHSLRDVDFRALFLELLVLVAGVLLALAADRWNQARLDAIETGRIVARLKSDTARNLAMFDEALPEMETGVRDIKALYRALQAGSVTAADRPQIEAAITNIDVVPSYPLLFAAYDELVATGRLRQLEDPVLVDLLADQRAEYDSAQAVVGYWRDNLLRSKRDLDQHVDYFYANEQLDEEGMAARFDITELAADRGVRNVVFEAIDVHNDWLERQIAIHQITQKIGARLGVR